MLELFDVRGTFKCINGVHETRRVGAMGCTFVLQLLSYSSVGKVVLSLSAILNREVPKRSVKAYYWLIRLIIKDSYCL